jgi:DNA gyrase subunit A
MKNMQKLLEMLDDNDDVLIISSDGVIIRMAAVDINVYGRATQGVRVMRVDEGVKVISIARTEKELAEDEDEQS